MVSTSQYASQLCTMNQKVLSVRRIGVGSYCVCGRQCVRIRGFDSKIAG